jgi:hypothetical protein
MIPILLNSSIPRCPEGLYNSSKEACDALNAHSVSHGYHTRIKRSKPNNVPQEAKRIFYLVCDRQGAPPPPTSVRPRTSSRACGCQYQAVIRRISQEPLQWSLESYNDHNHPPSLSAEAHPGYRMAVNRQAGGGCSVAVSLLSTGIRPAEVLSNVRDTIPDTLIRPRDIYNLQATRRRLS